MSAISREVPVHFVPPGFSACALVLDVLPEGERCVVRASGELDLATRDQLFMATTAGNHREMVLDLAAVTFMECSGYGSIVASRHFLERSGRSLTLRGQTGQPAMLLDLIAQLERGR